MRSPAGRLQILMELMYLQDEEGDLILDENGEPKESGLITKEQILKLLGFEDS